jgi:hypothetical protein
MIEQQTDADIERELWEFVNKIADLDDKECCDDPIVLLAPIVAWARKLTGKLK